MPSKCGLFLALLFSLAQADSVEQEKSTSLSFGPPATHATFDTAPLNPRRRLFGDNVDDQTSVLAFAKWYIEHLLNYPEDTWRVEESDVRKDPITAAWRVDARQLVHNGTIEIVDGNISLNILNGEVISYGDSFYRGPPPDLTPSDTPFDFADFNSYPVPVGSGQYNLQSYCVTTSEVARKQWMRENPKWVEWAHPFQKSRKAGAEWAPPFQKSRKAWDKLHENQEKCQVNIERALEKCIEEHSSSSAPTAWFRRAWLRFRLEVLKDHSSDAYGYIPEECIALQMRVPLDFRLPLPFKVPTTYDEDTCTWNFSTDHTTASARLYSLRQSHCEVRPKPELRCQTFDYSPRDIGFESNYELNQLMQDDDSELMEKNGIMDPAIAALVFVVSFPHGESESFQSVMGAAKDALGRIESRRRPEGGRYAFELKNVPGADGPVNATLVYVQTPPRRPHEMFTLEEEDDHDKRSEVRRLYGSQV
ncbi:hypothetical protein M407DRAFT_30548 [Tulasnella calospora MUT 4182]|uniref:Uncharacterized protein n=1 Tax=Tulasnella calospora MUT 4182 TaxID=1051891 RepID=A0A0C3Q761_9AGAM|nr:hypothetical protein M407DRAFT_30548 [Tulasnella calospora MUT 4182]